MTSRIITSQTVPSRICKAVSPSYVTCTSCCCSSRPFLMKEATPGSSSTSNIFILPSKIKPTLLLPEFFYLYFSMSEEKPKSGAPRDKTEALRARREAARLGGGDARIESQHKKGKLTADRQSDTSE